MVYIYVAAAVTADVAADITADVAGRTELKVQVKIRQPEEFGVFNALRLSVEVLTEILAAEVLVKLAGETELARTELVRTEPVA